MQGETIDREPPLPLLRILVVDDNVDSAESWGTLLGLLGHEIRIAHDGPSALEASRGFRPDVVLQDIGMPGMNGYEVARRMRKDPATAGAMLVAITGYGRDEDRRDAHDAGFDHHLTKPADLRAVDDLMRSHVLGKIDARGCAAS
jgi:CheY-like chemotaxis protein